MKATRYIIDSHQHYWSIRYDDYGWLTPALDVLYRDFGPEHLAPHLEETGVHKTILVQAAPTVHETERLLLIGERERTVAGVVGWVPLDEQGIERKLARFARHPKFLGVRPMLQDIDDVDWINSSVVLSALRVLAEQQLTFDALVRPRHLRSLLRAVDTNPDLRVVIDHAAKPEIAIGEFQRWASDMTALAQCRGVYCKLSGLLTEAGPNCKRDTLRPYVEHLITHFGTDRLMWGSDWPVLATVSTYRYWYEMAHDLLQALDRSQKDQVFGETAIEFYALSYGHLCQ